MKKAVCVVLATFFIFLSFSACSIMRITNPLLQGDVKMYILTNAEKLMLDQAPALTEKEVLSASLAKNEYEGMQFAIRSENDIKNLSVSMSELKNEEGKTLSFELYRQRYINVEETYNSDLKPGFYPDALIPIGNGTDLTDVNGNENQGYWITVHADSDTSAGIYTGTIKITYDNGELEAPVSVEVWDFELPVTPSFKSSFALATWSTDKIYAAVGADTQQIKEDYYWFLTKYRLSAGDIPVGVVNGPDDFIAKASKYFEDDRVSSVKLPYWHSFDENGNLIHSENNDRLAELLEEKGYTDKAFYYLGHLIDEPADNEESNRKVQMYCEDIRSYTDITHLVTIQPRDSLLGIVDDWCPIWNRVTEETIRERQALGESFWWYGCVAPQYPYPTYHIPDRTISSRIVIWMQKDYDVDGLLYWATSIMDKYDDTIQDYVPRDFWNDPFAFPGAAGDGYLIYAGTEDDGIVNRNIPVPTIRLESIRDGAEDYEYLLMVENKYKRIIEEYGLDVDINEIMDTFYRPLYYDIGNFNDDPELLQHMRQVLANEILAQDDVIVDIIGAPTTEDIDARKIIVYANKNSDVEINGEKITGTDIGENFAVFTATMTVDATRTAEISVNGIQHDRIISKPDINEYKDLAQKLIEENSAPDVIITQFESGVSNFLIKITAPQGSLVKVNGNEATKKTDHNGEIYYEYLLTIPQTAAVYRVEVSSADTTRTFDRIALRMIKREISVLDLDNPETVKAIENVASNNFGTATEIIDFGENKALSLTFSKALMTRFMLRTDEFKNIGSLSNYTHIRILVTNPTQNYNDGITVSLSNGSATVVCTEQCSLEPNQTVAFDFEIPKDRFGDQLIPAIDTLRLNVLDNSTEQTYVISSIQLISK